jgi:hypothetical protein
MADDPATSRRRILGLIAASPAAAALAADVQSAPPQPGKGLANVSMRLADYHFPEDERDWKPALERAFDALSSTRTAHPAYPRWGVGILEAGRGIISVQQPPRFSGSQVGFGIVGAGRFATVFSTNIGKGQLFFLNPSAYNYFADFTAVNDTRDQTSERTDAAFSILGTDGAHMTAFSRIVFGGFTYGISISGTTNGDYTHVSNCEFGTRYAYTNSHNKNAVSAIFDGCSFGCTGSAFLLGGSGEVTMRGGGANVARTLIAYTEGAGINGIYPQSVAVDHVKLEYGGTDDDSRLLIDGRDCTLSPDAGGADTVTVLRDTTYALGDHPPGTPVGPAYDRQVIIDLAGGRHRVHAWGGYIRGTIRYASSYLENRARWLFGRMRAAPIPSRLHLDGTGTHPLVEWWGNEGIADQYRGGQSGLRCIRTGTALLWRHTADRIVNTGIAASRLSLDKDRTWYGGAFTIDLTEADLPPLVTIEGLALFIRGNAQATDTRIEWFSNAAFSSLHDTAIVPGNTLGKFLISAKELTVTDGKLRVRIAKPGPGDDGTTGALVIYYFPYMI